jgi:transcriptional regulator with XRE-family HTH domain
MDVKDEIRDFLSSRRARITPEQAGLPVFGGPRRVPGLRREEAAMLAGVSVQYYTKMERGHLGGVSESVLEALARGLQLDEPEREHLFDLARAAGPMPRTRRRAAPKAVRPSVQQMIDAVNSAAVVIKNGRWDIVAANQLGYALFFEVGAAPGRPASVARYVFLDERSRNFYVDWDAAADDIVALLRGEAGRDPHDRALTDMIGELATRSEPFRGRWAAHAIRAMHTGVRHLLHPVVGDLALTFEAMELKADPGLTVLVFSAEPGSTSEEALRLLGSWAATPAAEHQSPPG